MTLLRRSSRTRLSLVGGLAAVLLAATACGGSSGDSTTPGGSEKQAGGRTLAQVEKAGVITVGTEGTYRPFTYHENGSGELTGYDVEVMKAVGEELGVDVKFEETQWDAIFAGLDAGRFDAIANQVSITPERQADYDFSTPYTVSPGVIVVNKGDDSISSFADLEGQDHRAVADQQLVRAGQEERRRTSRTSRAGPRPSRCSSRAASTPPSTTS